MGRSRPQRGIAGTAVTAALITVAVGLTAAPIAYMLWPLPRPVSVDAPALPITIGGVAFNIPPAAIRVPMQRRPGAQGRVDLGFLWPSLMPPDPNAKPAPTEAARIADRIFVTIAATDGTLPPLERLKTIYPRYTETAPLASPAGLTAYAFRVKTPYQGEDLIYDHTSPEKFLLRCSRKLGATPGTCLHERRIGDADITVRFPRDWLADWRGVADGIERLMARLSSG
jgi:hypothetical protein